jgi:hypothetical protein
MTIERPMFPPQAESAYAFASQPATQQPSQETLASESPKPGEMALVVALGRLTLLAVERGVSLEDMKAAAIAELEHQWKTHGKKVRRRMTLVGMRLVPVEALS